MLRATWSSALAISALLGCAGERPALSQRPSQPPAPATASPTAATTETSTVVANGCGKPPSAIGERRLQVGNRTGLFVLSIPSHYDPARRYPLGFAFHGRNRNHLNCQQTDCTGVQSVMGEQAVLVYPQSMREPLDRSDSGWEWPTELDDNVRFFDAVLAQVESELCIDERRIFLTGSSSGGTFANLLGCRYGDRLLAIAPVSGGWSDVGECRGSPAALVMHGIDDPHVPIARGFLARASYAERASCSATTTPIQEAMHDEVRKARDASPSVEVAKCVDYLGCAAGHPLRWCEHSYGGYDGSTHGWPPVGGQLVWDFVSRL